MPRRVRKARSCNAVHVAKSWAGLAVASWARQQRKAMACGHASPFGANRGVAQGPKQLKVAGGHAVPAWTEHMIGHLF